jgi:hypothetical protein
MDFTFGIITNGKSNLDDIINSIRDQNIQNYEIIIVGEYKNNDIIDNDINHIEYNDKSISGDISIKKNIITENSRFDNIVYLHDYIKLDKDWYNGFLKFGSDFDICMNIILNKDGARYRDWCLWSDDAKKYNINNYLIPYEMEHLSSMMYISGAYWVGKKKFMLENKLNESLSWGQGEDVEWSIRSRKKTDFKMNKYSKVLLTKNKDRIFNETNESDNLILYGINRYDDSDSYNSLVKKHLYKWLNIDI